MKKRKEQAKKRESCVPAKDLLIPPQDPETGRAKCCGGRENDIYWGVKICLSLIQYVVGIVT
jgi:hypothetical protein